jgi:hypothetical protein
VEDPSDSEESEVWGAQNEACETGRNGGSTTMGAGVW